MRLPSLVVILACGVVGSGCSSIVSAVVSGPKIVSVTISAPAGLLVGDSAIATAVALGDDGRDHGGRTRNWSSSDPSALPIDANGKMVALIAGRTVTITCEVDGTKGTATVVVASDDSRFGYALADQPSAAGPYAPAAGTSFNSGGGTIQVTRSSAGTYSVRFAGLGRQPGQRDNVQVSAYSSVFAYCKLDLWTTSGADLVVPVVCLDVNGSLADSRFTIMVIGAWAFGKTAPLGFALYQPDTAMNVLLDSLATTRNSTGGSIGVSHQPDGTYPVNFNGLGSASSTSPSAMTVTAAGANARRCRNAAYDKTIPGFDIICTGLGGGIQPSSWSLVWLQHGRPSMRFGFAWANAETSTTDYTPFADFLINSSGGATKSRKTALGKYHVVFSGLGRPAGASEIVNVSPLFSSADQNCDIVSWGNTGVNDLFVDIACYDRTGAAADSRFGVMVIQ